MQIGGFLGALTILFIALKLTAVIAWSWVWVLAPLWAPLAIVVILFIFALFVGSNPSTSIRRRDRW